MEPHSINKGKAIKTKDKMNRLMSDMTGQSLERIKRDVERDYFMSAEEALKYGIIDEIYTPRAKEESK